MFSATNGVDDTYGGDDPYSSPSVSVSPSSGVKFVPLSSLNHSILPLQPSEDIVPGLYPPSTLLASEILKVLDSTSSPASPRRDSTSWVLPSSPSFPSSPTSLPPPPLIPPPAALSGYFRVVIDLEKVAGGYVGFCCGTLQDLESIATETEGIVVRCHADNGIVTLLAVRLPQNQFVRAELSFRSSDGCVSVTLDGVEVVQFDEGFCIGAELMGIRQFVYAGGKGGVIEGAFQWDKGSWIEELGENAAEEGRAMEEKGKLIRHIR